MTAIRRILNLTQTIGAACDVRQYERALAASLLTRADFKIGVAVGFEPGGFNGLNRTARRLFALQATQKLLECLAGTFDFQGNALRRVIDPTVQREPRSEPMDERAKPDALDRTTNNGLQPEMALCWWS
jgi:hypothetical protein